MTDEAYLFKTDMYDKKRTARGAFNKRTHTGKGGSVKFPSDYLTRKEVNAMNGEVKQYCLNKPIAWREFRAMPDDLKIEYIKRLREKFNVSDNKILEMIGISQSCGGREIQRLGLSVGKHNHRGKTDWAGWINWLHQEESQEAEEIKAAETCQESEEIEFQRCVQNGVVPVSFVKEVIESTRADAYKSKQIPIVPSCGTMTFESDAQTALKAIGLILGESHARMTVTWELMPQAKVSDEA